MVFIVVGIALGYWVLTGKATNFLHAINTGSPQGTQQVVTGPTIPQFPNLLQQVFPPYNMQQYGEGQNVDPMTGVPQYNDIYIPGSNMAPNNPVSWNTVA